MTRKQIQRLVSTAVLLSIGGLSMPCTAQVRLAADAVAGKPFGVGRLTVVIPKRLLPQPLGVEGLHLAEKDGRLLYPAPQRPAFGTLMQDLLATDTPLTTGGPIREQVGGLLRGILAAQPPQVTIYFLFRGDGPLHLTLRGRSAHEIVVAPRNSSATHKRMLDAWWGQYTATPSPLQQKPDYPPLVDNFLTTTLARRLQLKLPETKQTKSWQDELKQEIGLTFATEPIRVAMQQDRILGLNHLDQPADQPMPKPLDPVPPKFPPAAADVAIEPIAMRVPAECFYVRFGSFANFLWVQDTLAKWNGDFQNLISARGLDYAQNERLENQLVIKQTALSRLLGGTVIADVAMVGTDMFFREGAAYGLLFHARQSKILGADIELKRTTRLEAGGVTDEKIKLAGREVSYLSSPDGSVRSYYAVDGDFHFVTTSRTLARRFLEAGAGTRALGSSPGFRHARSKMPLEREDTVFVYLSDAFFHNFTGPQYRIEMTRRLQATADISLVRMAVLAAATEGKPGDTIERLVAGGLLPKGFGTRPDGSRAVLEKGQVYDRLRGHHGAFVPVPDVTVPDVALAAAGPVDRVTRAEAAAYQRFADFLREKWHGRFDPMIVAVKRHELKDRREQIVIDAQLSPFAAEHFEFLSQWAGAPDKLRLTPVQGDKISGEIVLKDQRIFGGLWDFGPPPPVPGRVLPIGRLRDVLVGHIGTTGQPGVLGLLDRISTPVGQPRGPVVDLLAPWKLRTEQFSVYSFHPEVLAWVVPRLKFRQAEGPAQLRLRIDDLSQARMTPLLNNLAYGQSRETSLGNVRLMTTIAQQFQVPPADCKEAAEFLLGAKLVCPLGGEYELEKTPDGHGWWTSTGLFGGGQRGLLGAIAPQGYQAPPLRWFRGLDLQATMVRESLSAHAEIIMQMP